MLLLLLKILIIVFFFYCKATVVGRFSPSKGGQPVEPDIPEPDHPQSASTPQRHETPTVEKANSPSISCGQTPSTVGSPAAQNSNDQSASQAGPPLSTQHLHLMSVLIPFHHLHHGFPNPEVPDSLAAMFHATCLQTCLFIVMIYRPSSGPSCND